MDFNLEFSREADIEFNLKFDLTGVYNWNVKLIFVYLEIDYDSPNRNQVIVWDKIIWRDQFSQIKVDAKGKGKYMIKTKSHDLVNTGATARLRWEVVPIAGFVYKMQSEPIKFRFLEKYSY